MQGNLSKGYSAGPHAAEFKDKKPKYTTIWRVRTGRVLCSLVDSEIVNLSVCMMYEVIAKTEIGR